jgi:hypothetical protein
LKGDAAGCVAGAGDGAAVDCAVLGLAVEAKENGLDATDVFGACGGCCAEKLNKPDWEGTDVEGAFDACWLLLRLRAGAVFWLAACAKGLFTDCCAPAEKVKDDAAGAPKLKLDPPVELLVLFMLPLPLPVVAFGPPKPPNPLPLPNPPNDLLALMLPTAGAPFVGGKDCVAVLPNIKAFPVAGPVFCGVGVALKLNEGVGPNVAVAEGTELPVVLPNRERGALILQDIYLAKKFIARL